MALNDLGYRAQGVRLDSGDLAYLSVVTREAFRKIANQWAFLCYKGEIYLNYYININNNININNLHSFYHTQRIYYFSFSYI